MNLSGPKHLFWWLALLAWVGVILGVVGILAYLVPIAALAGSVFWLLGTGWLILAVVAGVVFLKYVKSFPGNSLQTHSISPRSTLQPHRRPARG